MCATGGPLCRACGRTLQELADQYLRDEAEKRAGNISAVKSFEAFRSG